MRKVLGLLLAPMIIGAVSCSDGGSTKDASGDSKMEKKPEATATVANKIEDKEEIIILPSPVEIATMVSKSGINYTEGITNPTERVEHYNSNYFKALNLGVYGADLGLILVFEQTQDAINYFTTVKTLAEELNVLSAFPQELLTRVEKNLNNRDSLITIATNSFAEVDKYLKENDRSSVSALMLAGGWIEAVNIAVQFAESAKAGDDIRTRVGEQKVSLETVIKMVSKYKNDGDGYALLYSQLEDLKTAFDKVEITYTDGEKKVDKESRVIVLERKSQVNMSDEVFQDIKSKIEAIRSRIVN
jgi:hypothetical protein